MPKLAQSAPGTYYTSGTVTTKTIDLGDVPVTKPKVTLGYTNPDASCSVKVLNSRSSSDGTNWTAWTAPDTDGVTLLSPLSRYWQVQVQLATTNTAFSPNLDSVRLDADKWVSVDANWSWGMGGRYQ